MAHRLYHIKPTQYGNPNDPDRFDAGEWFLLYTGHDHYNNNGFNWPAFMADANQMIEFYQRRSSIDFHDQGNRTAISMITNGAGIMFCFNTSDRDLAFLFKLTFGGIAISDVDLDDVFIADGFDRLLTTVTA